MLSVDEARARILSAFESLGTEQVGLENALGRVLAEPVAARLTQPAKAVSAMDGYAVRSTDLGAQSVSLRVTMEIPAGHAPQRPIEAGEAARIFTGAMLPEGADSVVIQENAIRAGDTVALTDPRFRNGQHVRQGGLDFKSGDIGLSPGRCLTARDIGFAAAMNWPWLTVTRRPRVAILSTGDELVNPGEALSPGKIVASNGYTLAALAAASGAQVLNLGNAPDQPERLSAMIDGARGCDLLVTIGGASVGDYDLVQRILQEKGIQLDFWKIAMRPGKPVMFGRLGDLKVIGLPGNPTSALVTALLFVRPAIARMLGQEDRIATEYAALGRDLPANDLRQDYLRASLTRDEDGRLIATPFNLQDSSLISLLAKADALVLRPPHAPAAVTGSEVEIIRLGGGAVSL
ncbi:gephyrin-like molybdotransferase Glp [Dongia soli]|uniref:Molybdopterin molybdenumtransferase n=1 Tax=Dongia soli TaxID=600628 RepID=A0ABU5E9L1_9PROT|nr:gephyrin-like molybdotransferase Glp [Dongia soli]MDY0883045.1 molybdopterin molybdotransferase MoeA [Dongia soli]